MTTARSHDPMSLEGFRLWCQATLALSSVPQPESDFRRDLGLDNLEVFLFVSDLRQLVQDTATVSREAYDSLNTVRELYLYYLTILSMPKN